MTRCEASFARFPEIHEEARRGGPNPPCAQTKSGLCLDSLLARLDTQDLFPGKDRPAKDLEKMKRTR